MSPIGKNSTFPRLHAGTIHKSNPEHLLVFKAPRRDDSQVQSGTHSCFEASRGDDPRVQSGTPPWGDGCGGGGAGGRGEGGGWGMEGGGKEGGRGEEEG